AVAADEQHAQGHGSSSSDESDDADSVVDPSLGESQLHGANPTSPGSTANTTVFRKYGTSPRFTNASSLFDATPTRSLPGTSPAGNSRWNPLSGSVPSAVSQKTTSSR